MSTVTITGLEKIVNNLRYLGNNVEQIIDKSLEKSANTMTQVVKDKITQVGAVNTGAMREDTKAQKYGLCRYAVVCPAPYAIYIEYGTGNAGDPTVAHTARDRWVYFNQYLGEYRTAYAQAARPFMRPAFAEYKDVIVANTRRAILAAWAKEMMT